MNAQVLDTIIAVLIRRGLSWIGIAVGGAAGVSDDSVAQAAAAVGSLVLIVANEAYQAYKLHKTQKRQGGVLTPAK